MTHHDNPILSVLLSMGAGVMTWFAHPVLWQSLCVALLTGIMGGFGHVIGKGIGMSQWRRQRRKLRQLQAKQRKPQ